MSRKEEVLCPECGATNTVSFHHLNQTTLRIFELLYPAYPKPVLVDEDTLKAHGMKYGHRTNGTKLQHWAFIEPYITQDTVHQRGWWRLTELGKQFAEGKVAMPRVAVTSRNELLRYEGELVYITDVPGGLKVHGDYADDKRQQILFGGDHGEPS